MEKHKRTPDRRVSRTLADFSDVQDLALLVVGSDASVEAQIRKMKAVSCS